MSESSSDDASFEASPESIAFGRSTGASPKAAASKRRSRRLRSRATPRRVRSRGSPEIPDSSPSPSPRLEKAAGISYSYGARSHFWKREGFFAGNAGALRRLGIDPARRVSADAERGVAWGAAPDTPRAAPHAPRLPSRRLNAESSARSKAVAQRPSWLSPSRARSSDPPNAATPAK